MPVIPILENTLDNEEAAYKNLLYFVEETNHPAGWIHPCTFCGLPTWQVARLKNKIIYICKQCRRHER